MIKFVLSLTFLLVLPFTLFASDNKVVASHPSVYKEPLTGIEFVYVKGACYMMGDMSGDGVDTYGAGESNERPQHEVCVDDFYIGKYEVTGGQWKAIMGENPSSDSGCKPDDLSCPVEFITWSEVVDFISKLNARNSTDKFRLPTEAEWEYAARSGGKYERYAGGNDVDSVAWFTANSGEKTHPVGSKRPNGLGLYDMSGNVWEVTSDWYSADYYARSPKNNPTGPASGENHVIRGGCATGSTLNVKTTRRGSQPTTQKNGDGLRLVMKP